MTTMIPSPISPAETKRPRDGVDAPARGLTIASPREPVAMAASDITTKRRAVLAVLPAEAPALAAGPDPDANLRRVAA